MRRSRQPLTALLCCLLPVSAAAQTTPAPAAPTTAPAPVISHRFLDIQVLNLLARYRRIETSAGVVTSNQGQHQEAVRARLTFDASGHYALVAGLGTGSNFIGGWNNSGIGTPNDRAMVISLKHLYASVAPIKGVEAQYGGLAIARGETTEITSYDNDGYMAGERLIIKRPDVLHLDELSATVGYLGDTSTPNFLRRTRGLQHTNYVQFLAAKKISTTVSASADFTRVDGVRTVRSGIAVKAPKKLGVDLLRLEGYRRFDASANGYAAFIEKAATARLTLGLGVANIDLANGSLNADRFGKGQRWFANGGLTVIPELSLLSFYQHAFNNDVALTNESRFEILLQFNALKALQRFHIY